MKNLILLTGSTGYVGGRLRRVLEEEGRSLRVMARRPESLRARGAETTEVVQGDVLVPETLTRALGSVDTAYYLIHSMGSERDFEEMDRIGARNFAAAARQAGVKRIIYLGGIGRGDRLSAHLRSRHEVGDLLRESGVPVIELRASIVLGSGSLSFEMIRALVERLPIMITPRWVEVEAQPIAIIDLLEYLRAAADLPVEGSRTFEIGGADVVSYGGLMIEYARQRGLRRLRLRVPVLTPRLSSLWLGLVTPLYARIGRKLIDSIKHPTVVSDHSALEAFAVRPLGVADAIAAAIRNEDREFSESSWFDALSSSGQESRWGGVRFGNRLIDSRTIAVAVGPEAAFAPIARIGGSKGWYAYDWLWKVRGFLDLLVGGVGTRRGRPEVRDLRVGDAVDFWRVETIEAGRLLRLYCEMKLPGRAWLEFEVRAAAAGAEIRQTAIFDPVGLLGLSYWYGVAPLHRLVFARMLKNIARAAVSPGFLEPDGRTK